MCHTIECPAEEVLSRGLCRQCYRYLSRLVAVGVTTWEELENKDLSVPAYLHTRTRYHGPIDAAVRAAGINPPPRPYSPALTPIKPARRKAPAVKPAEPVAETPEATPSPPS